MIPLRLENFKATIKSTKNDFFLIGSPFAYSLLEKKNKNETAENWLNYQCKGE